MKKLNSEKTLQVVEVCSGIGATSMALKDLEEMLKVKFEVIGISEIDKKAIEAYTKLHGPTFNYGDITKADVSKLRCDVLSATTPCVHLSSLGNRSGFEEGANNGSSIVWELKRLLNTMLEKPSIIFMENVKNMVTTYKSTFLKLQSYLESEGYNVYYKVLDANDFGLAQHRERVYIIATLKKVDFDFPTNYGEKVLLKDILEKDVDKKYYLKNLKDYFIKHSMETNYTFRVHNPSHAQVAYTLTTKCGSRISDNFVFEKDISEDKVVRIKSKFLEEKGIDLKDIEEMPIRKLTPNETMVLMGLNKEQREKLNGMSDSAIYKLMGNSVCLPVLKAIFYNFFKEYLKEE